LFADWLIKNGLVHSELRFGAFLAMVVQLMSVNAAHRLNVKTPGKLKRLGLGYFRDAVAAIALCILFGGAYRRIIRAETVEALPDPKEYWYIHKLVGVDGDTWEEREWRSSKVFLVNGEYLVIGSKLVVEFLYENTGDWFVISESLQALGCWTVGRKITTRTTMIQTAIGIARSSFVGMEIGRTAEHADPLITEHSDSLRSRDNHYRMNEVEMAYAWCEAAKYDEQAKDILRVELDRPEELEPNAFKYYRAMTNDTPHKQVYYRKLKEAREAMLTWLNEDY
jgi:hypothetical protein